MFVRANGAEEKHSSCKHRQSQQHRIPSCNRLGYPLSCANKQVAFRLRGILSLGENPPGDGVFTQERSGIHDFTILWPVVSPANQQACEKHRIVPCRADHPVVVGGESFLAADLVSQQVSPVTK